MFCLLLTITWIGNLKYQYLDVFKDLLTEDLTVFLLLLLNVLHIYVNI